MFGGADIAGVGRAVNAALIGQLAVIRRCGIQGGTAFLRQVVSGRTTQEQQIGIVR